ncbi:MAG: ABC transporter substrate-binding protein [Bacillus sp. (in: firmicutes)]
MNSKKVVFYLFFVVSLLLSACSNSTNSGEKGGSSNGGGTLIIGVESEMDVIDPHRAGGWVTMRVNNQIFEPLIGEDLSKSSEEAAVPELIPVLAKSWDVSEDGKTYTFHLREGVKFQDGTNFNAEAVAFNINRLTDEKFEYYDKVGAGRTFRTWKYYESNEVVDDQTIKIHLKAPFSEFPRMLGQINSLQIMSPTSIEKYGNDKVGEHPAGTGPFTFESRKRGENVTLVKNEAYWGEKAKLDKVIFRPLSDSASRVLAMKNDEVDIIAVPPPDSLEDFKKKNYQVLTGTPPHVWYLSFNFDNKYMQDVKVRQAINYAINREGIANELLKGSANPAYVFQSPGSTNYDSSKKWYEYNVDKAKELMKEAGYSNGFETTLQTSIDGSGQLIPVDIAEWIQRDLAEIGVKVKLETKEWITYLSNYSNGMSSEVGMNQFSSGRTSPFFLAMIAHSDFKAPGGMNSGKYVNNDLDAILDKAANSLDEKKALDLWKQGEEIIMNDAAFAPIVNDSAPYVVNNRVKGFVVPSEEWYTLAPVWIEQ